MAKEEEKRAKNRLRKKYDENGPEPIVTKPERRGHQRTQSNAIPLLNQDNLEAL